MKSTQQLLLVLLLLCLIFMPVSGNFFSNQEINNLSYDKTEIVKSNLSYISHSSIYITNDSELGLFPGAGTTLDPFRIENYNITTNSDYGIFVTNVTKYFIIQDCYISAKNWSIFVYDISDNIAFIYNNSCYASFNGGISVTSADGARIQNNKCLFTGGKQPGAGIGIYCYMSNDLIINFNDCSFNNNTGIKLFDCDYALVEKNLCFGSKFLFEYDDIYTWGGTGLRAIASYNCTIRNNDFLSNFDTGVSMDNSQNSFLINNTFERNPYGIRLDESAFTSISFNTFRYNDYGCWIQDSSSLNIEYNNFSYSSESGLFIEDSNWLLINNNTLEILSIGINSENCKGHVITNNSIIKSSFYGIMLTGSDNKVYGNYFMRNYYFAAQPSQAYDSGENNTWYNSEKKFGNHWSDLDSKCIYKIDGPSDSEDIYPLNAQAECADSWFSPIRKTIIIVILIIIGIFSITYGVLNIIRIRKK